MNLTFICATAFAVCCISSSAAVAKEYPIEKAQEKAGMNIAAVYLQPIEMDPPGMMRDTKESDIHLEADIKAAKELERLR